MGEVIFYKYFRNALVVEYTPGLIIELGNGVVYVRKLSPIYRKSSTIVDMLALILGVGICPKCSIYAKVNSMMMRYCILLP